SASLLVAEAAVAQAQKVEPAAVHVNDRTRYGRSLGLALFGDQSLDVLLHEPATHAVHNLLQCFSPSHHVVETVYRRAASMV
nr:hypothetical protein [Tanacetum cinerariifolium]